MTGLYPKYVVIDKATGREIEGFVFVLKPETDDCARAALREYIEVVHPTNPRLAADLSYALQKIEETFPVARLGNNLTPAQQEALLLLQRGGAWDLRALGGVTFAEMKAMVKRGLVEYIGFSGNSEFFQLARPQSVSEQDGDDES